MLTDANGNATELITWYFVGRIALQFVFLSLVIYLLLNAVRIILQSFGVFLPQVPEAPKPPLCTCGKWKYCLRQYTDCRGNWPSGARKNRPPREGATDYGRQQRARRRYQG